MRTHSREVELVTDLLRFSGLALCHEAVTLSLCAQPSVSELTRFAFHLQTA